MKYVIIVPDGAADRPIPSLSGHTPLEAATLETIDRLASVSEIGMVRTIPDGVAPGSDAANLSVMGYDPGVYLTGRSPLEAVSMGIDMADTDVAFRTNLVTLTGDGAYDDLIISDHSAGDISNEEAVALIEAVNQELATGQNRFYPGVSYRHALIMQNGTEGQILTPPHDVLLQRVGDHLPRGEQADLIEAMMRRSYEILKDHPINRLRVEKGLNPANTIWIWGQGRKPQLPSFREKYGIGGSVISAVDLIKGIGLCAGLESIDVEGATGTLHSNFHGKAEAAVEALKSGQDFVYVHLEAPDECSHQGDLEGKLEALERIDREVAAPILAWLAGSGDAYRILIVPDHRTPLEIRTHSSEPVPYVLYDSRSERTPDPAGTFSEKAGERGAFIDSGHALADRFFQV